MKIERDEQGWIVRVPDNVAEALGVFEGTRVTLRPIPREKDELRYLFADMRDRLPDFPFDREDWDGVDVALASELHRATGFTWSNKPVPYPPR